MVINCESLKLKKIKYVHNLKRKHTKEKAERESCLIMNGIEKLSKKTPSIFMKEHEAKVTC